MIETIKDKSTARNEYNFVPGFVMDIQRKVKLEAAKEIAKAKAETKAEASKEIAKIEAKAKAKSAKLKTEINKVKAEAAKEIAKTKAETNKQTIQKMLQKGYDIEEIAELTGASIKEIENLKLL